MSNTMNALMLLQSMMFARAIAIVMVVVGLGILFNRKLYLEMMADASKNRQPLLMFVTGVVTFVFGLLMVMSHNFWSWNWTVLVTLFNWLVLLKGAAILLLPRVSIKLANMYKATPAIATVAGIVFLVLAAVFGYFGFLMN